VSNLLVLDSLLCLFDKNDVLLFFSTLYFNKLECERCKAWL